MHPLVSLGGGRTPVGCCTGCAVKLLSNIRHELTISSLEERAVVNTRRLHPNCLGVAVHSPRLKR